MKEGRERGEILSLSLCADPSIIGEQTNQQERIRMTANRKKTTEGEGGKGEPQSSKQRGRISTLEYLYQTNTGKAKLAEMLLAIQSGCYAHSAASMIGVTPNTFSKWLSRGRVESGTVYAEFWGSVVEALSIARCQAEIKVAQTNPLHYLTRGAGRILGDNYSEALTKQLYDHNVDGTVALPGQGHLTVREQDQDQPSALPSPTDHVGKAELIEALIELRKAGVDLNAMVEQQEKLLGVRHSSDGDSGDEGQGVRLGDGT